MSHFVVIANILVFALMANAGVATAMSPIPDWGESVPLTARVLSVDPFIIETIDADLEKRYGSERIEFVSVDSSQNSVVDTLKFDDIITADRTDWSEVSNMKKIKHSDSMLSSEILLIQKDADTLFYVWKDKTAGLLILGATPLERRLTQQEYDSLVAAIDEADVNDVTDLMNAMDDVMPHDFHGLLLAHEQLRSLRATATTRKSSLYMMVDQLRDAMLDDVVISIDATYRTPLKVVEWPYPELPLSEVGTDAKILDVWIYDETIGYGVKKDPKPDPTTGPSVSSIVAQVPTDDQYNAVLFQGQESWSNLPLPKQLTVFSEKDELYLLMRRCKLSECKTDTLAEVQSRPLEEYGSANSSGQKNNYWLSLWPSAVSVDLKKAHDSAAVISLATYNKNMGMFMDIEHNGRSLIQNGAVYGGISLTFKLSTTKQSSSSSRSGVASSAALLSSSSVAAGAFSDVPAGHTFADAIEYVKSEGIVSGYDDGTYRPDATINRAEFVKILINATPLGSGASCGSWPGSFPDVPQDAWYAVFVCLAHEYNYVGGYPDGTFKPGNPVNIAEALKIVAMAKGLPLDESVGPWYQAYVDVFEKLDALPTNIRSYDQSLTRGEMAQLIWQVRDYVVVQETDLLLIAANQTTSTLPADTSHSYFFNQFRIEGKTDTATNVLLDIEIPSGFKATHHQMFTGVGNELSTIPCTTKKGVLTCEIGTVRPGTFESVVVRFENARTCENDVTVEYDVSVRSDEDDLTPGNNVAIAESRVGCY